MSVSFEDAVPIQVMSLILLESVTPRFVFCFFLYTYIYRGSQCRTKRQPRRSAVPGVSCSLGVLRNLSCLLFKLLSALNRVSRSDLTLLEDVERSRLVSLHLFDHNLFNIVVDEL